MLLPVLRMDVKFRISLWGCSLCVLLSLEAKHVKNLQYCRLQHHDPEYHNLLYFRNSAKCIFNKMFRNRVPRSLFGTNRFKVPKKGRNFEKMIISTIFTVCQI
jgi:hypothetical protein